MITSSNPEDVALANEMIKTMYEKENTRIEKMGKKTMLIDQTKEKIKLMDDIINTNDGRFIKKHFLINYSFILSVRGQQWVKSIMTLRIFDRSYFDSQQKLKMTTMS